MAYAIKHRGQIATASGLDVLAGVWLLISPFVLHFPRGAGMIANDVIFGIIIAFVALYRTLNPAGSSGASWLNVLLGFWVILSPWILAYTGFRTATANSVILGIIVVILSAWSALASTTDPTNRPDMTPPNPDQP